ncbi:unnamed protein product [Rotaria sp. Silwood2]|nr:unnamed protein product [Rotaria sp. Silwood2]CAF2519445.1 unnamed protein product [Rotaria sp. Silwood2]CAF2918061.1 unnamed protein product [Rotaria sp. Silwood2]CAF4067655.1 unnamed protein product [Rotaria sp. Silwood2]CAF4241679.1 unnamed protein product [Rotaria sp. Silwood2]
MDHDHHDHMHHHADMVVTTTTMMNHAHHMMTQQTNTSSVHSGHGSRVHDMMAMAMTFHGGFKEQILFEQWDTKTIGAFIGSWFLIFFVAVLYEGLKTIRDQLSKRDGCQCGQTGERQPSLLHHQGQQCENSNNNDLIPRVQTVKARTNKRGRLLSLNHLAQTILHILQMGISYLLMLIAMTFNIYLFLAIILGAGLGHFLFAWRRSSVIDYNEHCH